MLIKYKYLTLQKMQTTISVIKSNVSLAVEELATFSNVSFRLRQNDVFSEILVNSEKETDIEKVRIIEKKYNHESGRKQA